MNGLLHVLGIDDASGRWYLAWSGFGSDLAYLGIIGALYRKHHCHQCWRIGRHTVDGSPYCGRHHEQARKNR